MLANAVGHLAEAAFHHPDLHLSYGLVKVTLKIHSAEGITEKELDLARRIEVLIMWRPAGEGGRWRVSRTIPSSNTWNMIDSQITTNFLVV